jgi:hypothetical protein
MLAWLYFRCNSAVEANGLLASILGMRPHPGAAIAPLELWIVAIVAIDHTLGSGAWRLQSPRHWARAVAWGSTGMLLAAGLAAMPLVRLPFIYFSVLIHGRQRCACNWQSVGSLAYRLSQITAPALAGGGIDVPVGANDAAIVLGSPFGGDVTIGQIVLDQ